jgi:hypothetical protein
VYNLLGLCTVVVALLGLEASHREWGNERSITRCPRIWRSTYCRLLSGFRAVIFNIPRLGRSFRWLIIFQAPEHLKGYGLDAIWEGVCAWFIIGCIVICSLESNLSITKVLDLCYHHR